MNILVTGGAGFIGANFLYWQRRHRPENTLFCVDSLTYAGNAQNVLPLLGSGASPIMGYLISCTYAVRQLKACER